MGVGPQADNLLHYSRVAPHCFSGVRQTPRGISDRNSVCRSRNILQYCNSTGTSILYAWCRGSDTGHLLHQRPAANSLCIRALPSWPTPLCRDPPHSLSFLQNRPFCTCYTGRMSKRAWLTPEDCRDKYYSQMCSESHSWDPSSFLLWGPSLRLKP